MRKNSAGFSLVEIIISLGLLVALSFGVMQVQKMMSKTEIDSKANFELQTLKHEIFTLLKDPRYCRISLGGLKFKKSEIDDKNLEGVDIDLWLSDVKGTARTRKKFSATDPNLNQLGPLKLEKLQLIMDNPTKDPSNPDYPDGTFTDRGKIKVLVSKGQSHKMLQTLIDVELLLTTKDRITTIDDCSSDKSVPTESDKSVPTEIVIHSQSEKDPECPPDWTPGASGYSHLLTSTDEGITTYEDPGEPSSCLENFSFFRGIECNKNLECKIVTDNDYSGWLWSGKNEKNENAISRCRVCSKPSTKIKVVHSQNPSPASCPTGYTKLWSGKSVILMALSKGRAVPIKLSSTGSCLEKFHGGLPIVECNPNTEKCEHGTDNDYAVFLSKSSVKKGPAIESDVSACVVCQEKK